MQYLKKFRIHRWFLILCLSLGTVGCDQVTKTVVRDSLSDQVITLMGGIVRLQHAENTGVFLSFGENLPGWARFIFFIVIVAIFLIGLIWFLMQEKKPNSLSTIGLTLILAGGVGNLIDRMEKGSVTDFLNIGIGWLRTGIFNIADMAIIAGIMLVIYYLRLRKT